MKIHIVLLSLFGLSTALLDFFIRTKVAPTRRDWFIRGLLGKGSKIPALIPVETTSEIVQDPVSTSLLKHFGNSFASREVVSALATDPGGLTGKELEERFVWAVTREGKRSLPPHVVRKVTMNLMKSDFIALDKGKFRITDLGRDVYWQWRSIAY